MCHRKKQKNKGITLIALVITIIVLLILAGLTISTDNANLQKDDYKILKEIVNTKSASSNIKIEL